MMPDTPTTGASDGTRGLGLLLRVVGVVIPLGGFFAAFFHTKSWEAPLSAPLVLQILSFLWAWPYKIYQSVPIAWLSLGLASVVLVLALLVVRRDWKGALTVLAWGLFWGWLLAAIVGDVRGT
jgi:hypothetical protein